MELLKKIKDTISAYSMLSEGDRVLIGLSGGPDSVCLAVILDKLRTDFNLSLSAVYIDHGLRPEETVGEREFCRVFCDKRGIQFFSETIDVKAHARDKGLSIQEAARELRYGIFEKIAWDMHAVRIALGHNADDRTETFLINLFRGSGRRGLSGIPPVRGKIIRPLIEVERREIEEFLLQKKGDLQIAPTGLPQPYIVDSSNLKKNYFRNWIRLELLAEMRSKNPSVVQNICRTMDILQEEDEYLEITVTKTLIRLISRKSNDTVELFLSPLGTINRPILRRVLRRVLDETEGLRGMDFIHIEDMIDLIRKGSSGDRIFLPKGIRVIKDYSTLVITSRTHQKLNQAILNVPGEVVLKEGRAVIKAFMTDDKTEERGDVRTVAEFDADKTGATLTVRSREKGDFFYPEGFGRRKKLQDFFVDNKIPRDERDTVPIVLSGDKIVWVAGLRGDERFRVRPETEKILRLIIARTS
ncbi:MAG: tRNA lysidine(34) synthetase TilS [Nitrospiraceae bacterium]|nr:MAG: tRNA lysidine(34) synthetase TilS [Nitrospiraceae bacterium]